jgi:molecular chaperone HscB
MVCWSCERAAGDGAFCVACQAVQPPPAGGDHFAALGVPRAFAQDEAALEQRYKELARQVHPDRFVRADPRARKAALARSMATNQAWKTLRDPVRRAEHLLALAGIEVAGEQGTRVAAAPVADAMAGSAAEPVRVPVPPTLLAEVMLLREALLDAKVESGPGSPEVAGLVADVQARRAASLAAVAAGFSATPPDLAAVTAALVALRYWDRFLSEAEATDPLLRKDLRHAG